MGNYLAGRLAALVPTLLIISLLAFGLTQLAGGDPAREALEQGGAPADADLVADLRTRWSLDAPLPVRYLRWLGGALQGDLGESWLTKRSVARELIDTYPATVLLAVAGMGLALVWSVPLGVIAAVRSGTWVDHLIRVTSVLAVTVPSFWLGLLLIVLFAQTLGWLPAGGYGLDRHLVLPAVALGSVAGAAVLRLVRSSVLEVGGQEFVRTARAKGLPAIQVFGRHVLPNALIPALTYLTLHFGHLLAGAVVIETIFAWPGVGRIVLAAISGRDLPVIAGYVLVTGVIYLALQILTDVLYSVIDPRIRL